MENALMIGLTRQKVLRRQMNLVANNIANMSTAGFKVEKLLLSRQRDTSARQTDGPRQVSFVQDRGVARDFTTGQIENTGRALDVALSDRGFFAVRASDGVRYTRNGQFSIDNNGTLSTADGLAVLDDSDQPIALDTSAAAPMIGKNGAILVDGQEIARLKVADFTNLGALQKTGDGRFSAPPSTAVLSVSDPGILQGHLERSNVVPVLEINRMIEITRSYQSISNLLNQQQNLTRRTIERLGSVR